MSGRELEIDGRLDGSRAIVSVGGEVDVQNADQLEFTLLKLLGPAAHLHVDLAGATYFDSSGLRVLVNLDQLLRSRAGSLTIHQPPDAVRRLMEMSGLTTIPLVDQPYR